MKSLKLRWIKASKEEIDSWKVALSKTIGWPENGDTYYKLQYSEVFSGEYVRHWIDIEIEKTDSND